MGHLSHLALLSVYPANSPGFRCSALFAPNEEEMLGNRCSLHKRSWVHAIDIFPQAACLISQAAN